MDVGWTPRPSAIFLTDAQTVPSPLSIWGATVTELRGGRGIGETPSRSHLATSKLRDRGTQFPRPNKARVLTLEDSVTTRTDGASTLRCPPDT